jgi:3-hydroxyisobutyrate dehydrogenase
MIAYLGTGLLGSGFVRALLTKGNEVNVWNRTHAKAKTLEQYGAKAYADVKDAIAGAERIHLTLKDDASVDEVLANATPAILPGTFIIDHTTTSVAGAISRTRYWGEKGINYVHAPVFMGPINSLESTGYMLVSGNQAIINSILQWIEPMTGKVINFGEETGRAAGMKLAGNHFLIGFTATISDTLGLLKAMGIPADNLTSLFDQWNPGSMLPGRLKRMMAGKFDEPSWELAMSRKDAGLMLREAEIAGKQLVVLPSIAAEMDKWIDKGQANSDWTVIAKDNL